LFEGKIAVCRQYREGIWRDTYGLPGGGIEPGEDIEAAARRELREETGLSCETLHLLGKTEPVPWLTNQISHLFFTKETARHHDQELDEGENISVAFHKLEEIEKQIKNGNWSNSELVHALFLAKQKGYL
ncbi:MAG TPA: NUDIX hydrolase, partial [Bacillales bacterium]|nr:NUDIX hydrolase [Bacillales bacterium]